MQPVQQLNSKFDIDKILNDIQTYVFDDIMFCDTAYDAFNQIALHNGDGWFEGVGSLYDYEQQQFTRLTSDFSQTSNLLDGSYLADCIEQVREQAKVDGVSIGRIRLMRLKAKTCYTLHQDPEEFRYHIPLVTNDKALFIIGEQLFRMPVKGSLYKFQTNDVHTAINASFEDRLHIVFDTY